MGLRTIVVDSDERLRDPAFVKAWQSLHHGSPMQSPAWLTTWWNVYGKAKPRKLCVAVVQDEHDKIVAVAPWYIHNQPLTGATLRMLGDGEVCSDYATIAVIPERRRQATAALADWLHQSAGKTWQKIHFASIDLGDASINALAAHLRAFRFEPQRVPNVGCSLVRLPDSWETYLSEISKNHRKRCRRWWRDYFETQRAKVVCAHEPAEINEHWQTLVQLHCGRRRDKQGDTAFNHAEFYQFHRQFIDLSIPTNLASLQTLFVDDKPVATEYLLLDADTVYCYQSGAVTRRHRDGYGNLSVLAVIRSAIENGFRHVDFLRGEEAYKSHWNGKTQAAIDFVVRAKNIVGLVDGWFHQAIDQARDIKSQLVGS